MKFFAEALQKLGIINIAVVLDSPSNEDTVAVVTEGSYEAILHHDGEVFNILLPVRPTASRTVTFPSGQEKIEIRAHMVKDLTQHPRIPLFTAERLQSRWDNDRHIACRACRRLIILPHALSWKDLPSQRWIEFSDYWHCHSGSNSHTGCGHVVYRGPDLPNLRAFPGTVFVGPIYLVFNFCDTQYVSAKVPSP
jgi:HECT-like Ubiquitin-conjugating enzyme (E2)-binding